MSCNTEEAAMSLTVILSLTALGLIVATACSGVAIATQR
jgi:hypothetical protein